MMMAQRTKIFLILALAAMGAAFLLHLLNFYSPLESEPFFVRAQISGVAIEYKGQLYTLNFEQQNQFLSAINRSLPTTREFLTHSTQKPIFSKLVIYRFQGVPVEILPVAFFEENLVFSIPALKPQDLRVETSEGELHKMLLKTFDH